MTAAGRWQMLTFAGIGIINTSVDVAVFLTLLKAGVPLILANIISTSAGLACSYFLNRRFTFNHGAASQRSLPLFLLVTLIGIWILQPIVIKLCLHLFASGVGHHILILLFNDPSHYYNLLAKLLASPVTLIWNYIWYKKVVFKPAPKLAE